jgi:hypothetical protein
MSVMRSVKVRPVVAASNAGARDSASPTPSSSRPTGPASRSANGRGRHAVGGAHEQRVAAGVAQPPQPVADRRLRQAQARGGGRHAARIVHRDEQAQQVQVELGQQRIVHSPR